MLIVFIVIGCIFIIAFNIVRIKKPGLCSLLLKTLSSAFFFATALCATWISENYHYGIIIVSALLFGLLGDVFLDLKINYKEQKNFFLITGFASFLLEHILLLCILMCFYKWSLRYIIFSFMISIAVTILILLLEKPMHLEYAIFKPVVGFYSFFLAFVTSFSGFTTLRVNTAFFFAMILFLISDLILGHTYFGNNKNGPIYILSNHILYYVAQYIIAITVLYY